jgi:predicted nucleic acid-binding protein
MQYYFVDTSVWINYFRDSDKDLNDWIDDLLDENRIIVNGIVIAELLIGALNKNKSDILINIFNGLRFSDLSRDDFEAVGHNGFLLRRQGVSVPMNDLIIATSCIKNKLPLIEQDKHYDFIASHLPLTLKKNRLA